MIRNIFSFCIFASIKIVTTLCYRRQFCWTTPPPASFHDVRILILLNHTSLYDMMYISAFPFSWLWHVAKHISVAGADITLNRPLVGLFWKLMCPGIQTISRKRDESWEFYLQSLRNDHVVFITPEGRMKRPNGLDKHGRPMTVKSGVAEILEKMEGGTAIICLTGGLHHVQAPGQKFPRLFQTIRMNIECHEIQEYKANFAHLLPEEARKSLTQDLQYKLEHLCPTL